MRLAVVTVNYCCADEIARSADVVASQIAAAGGEWWIVDNDSPDDSAEILERTAGGAPNVHLIRSERNGGFGYGNNQVINRILSGEIDAEYIYFLNPDAVPEPGAIEQLAAYLDHHPEVGVVGSGLLNAEGTHTASMFRFPSLLGEFEANLSFGPVSRLLKRYQPSLGKLSHPGPVGWVAGTSFMVRTDVFHQVGAFDEDFFLYWEEVELCHRIAEAGYAIHGVPGAKVRHIGGLATGMHNDERRIPAYWHQSRNLYFTKTGGPGLTIAVNLTTGVALAARRALEFLRRKPFAHPHLLRDHLTHATWRRSSPPTSKAVNS